MKKKKKSSIHGHGVVMATTTAVQESDLVAKTMYDYFDGSIGKSAIFQIYGYLMPVSMPFNTNYSAIADCIEAAERDNDVEDIILKIASPGGSIEGISLVVDAIRKAKKPIRAVVVGNCKSAAYWIASQCDEIYATETSEVGSVGVVIEIINDKDIEVRYLVSSGSENKFPGSKQRQAELDAAAAVMIRNIADGRGWAEDEVLKKTGNGKSFIGRQALEAGLIDGILNSEEEISEMLKKKLITAVEKSTEGITAEAVLENAAAVLTYFGVDADVISAVASGRDEKDIIYEHATANSLGKSVQDSEKPDITTLKAAGLKAVENQTDAVDFEAAVEAAANKKIQEMMSASAEKINAERLSAVANLPAQKDPTAEAVATLGNSDFFKGPADEKEVEKLLKGVS